MTTPDPTQPTPSLVARLSLIQQTHPWVDPNVATTLAASPTPNSGLTAILDGLQTSIRSTWDGISHFFDDPVLQKEPSASLALHRYMTGALGPLPVADTDLRHVQAQIQAAGFGKELPADGVWNSAWNSAYQQHAQEHVQAQLAGDKPGSTTAGHAAHSFLSSILPTGALSGVLGFVKSIPGDVRTLAADTVGLGQLIGTDASAAIADTLVGGSGYAQDFHDNREASRDTARFIENHLGNNLTAEQERRNTTGGAIASKIINDVGTMFMFTPIGGAKSAVAKAAGEDISKAGVKVGLDEASRTGGVVSSTLYRTPIAGPLAQTVKKAVTDNAGQMLTRDATNSAAVRAPGLLGKSVARGGIGQRALIGGATGAVAGGVNADVHGGSILEGAEQGAAIGGLAGAAFGKLIPDRVYQNRPILGNVGPAVGRLYGEDGLYYKARTLLAAPYQYGAVRTAGSTLGALEVAGLKANAIGGAENYLGGSGQTDTIGSNINDVRSVLDTANDALKNKTQFTFGGHTFRPSFDDLGLLFHANVRDPFRPSTQVGDSATGVVNKANHLLGDVGAVGKFEQATSKSFAAHSASQGADGDAIVTSFISAKTNEAGVHYAALDAAQKTPGFAALETKEQIAAVQAEASRIWHDPTAVQDARAAMLAHGNYFQRYLQSQMTKGGSEYAQGMRAYVEAGGLLQKEVVPLSHLLLTPANVQVVADAAKAGERSSQTATYLADNGAESPLGALGLAVKHMRADGTEDLTKSTLTAQQAQKDATSFESELKAAQDANDVPAVMAVQQRMREYAFHNHGDNSQKLQVFEDTTGKRLLEHLQQRADSLAHEVFLPDDAPQALKAAVEGIGKRGYRLVAGTDIGHSFRSDLPPVTELGKPITKARAFISGMGLSPQNFSTLDIGARQRLEISRALDEANADPKNPFRYLPLDDSSAILRQMQDEELVGKQLGRVASAMFSLSPFQQKNITRIAEQQHMTLADAEALLKGQIAEAGGVTGLSRGDFQRVLGRTENLPGAYAARDDNNYVNDLDNVPMYSKEAIDAAYKAIQQGSGRVGTGMLGLGQVEPFLRTLAMKDRYSLPLTGGRVAFDNHFPLALQNLPTALLQARNKYRFQLSPFFSFRRVTKVNLKMALEGVTPTIDPVGQMEKDGTFSAYHDILDRVNGGVDSAYKNLDENDRLLNGQDIFGLFNSRHFEAYYAGQKAAQGASDADIKAGLIRTFKYGSDANGEGRTALERTANTIFFPFSFEKTVNRNLGGYLLDHPAQAIVLSNALDMYKEFNNAHKDGTNPLAASFYQQHVPLLNEALRLNTFEHGISPGEMGGINAPLLNAFLPQSWNSNAASSKTLGRFVPMVTDLQRIIKEGGEQSRITVTALSNAEKLATGSKPTVLNPLPSTKTDSAQRTSAFDLRSQLIAALQPVLDKNEKTDDKTAKVTWPNTDTYRAIGIAGRPVNKTTIGEVVHAQFPAYDPTAGAGIKIANTEKAERFIASQHDPTRQALYRDFNDKALTVAGNLNNDNYQSAQAAQILNVFRQQAAVLAGNDPRWYAMYNKVYRSVFGPLEKQ